MLLRPSNFKGDQCNAILHATAACAVLQTVKKLDLNSYVCGCATHVDKHITSTPFAPK